MEKTLKVYSNGEVVGSQVANTEGATTVSITGLEAGTTYPAGTFKVAFANDSGESDQVDVPEFTTTTPEPAPEGETGV
ncbi:tail morphogenetic protein [Staphylococcus phage vB_Sau_S24]|nr:tail morphogenetic protein [Staphylococcus phage vB_Sau_S24]